MSTRYPFVLNASLTAIAIAFRNPDTHLIADQVLPRVPVGGERFKWLRYALADAFTLPDQKVGRKGRVNEVEFGSSEQDGSTADYALDAPLPNKDIEEARKQREAGLSTYDPEAHATQQLADLIALGREVRVAGVVQDPTNYVPANVITIADANSRFDVDASDPFAVLDEALDQVLGFRPNKLVMGQPVWTKLKKHPRLIKAVKGGLTDEGAITRQQLAELLEVQEILVGESRLNVATPGQPANLSRVWGKSIAGLYINRMASTEAGLTWGLTAQNGTRVAGTIEDPMIGMHGGRRTRVGEAVRELVVAPECGFLIQNAVS